MAASEINQGDTTNSRATTWVKLSVLTLLAVAGIVIYVRYGDLLSLEALAARESQLRAVQQKHPLFTYGAAFLVYVSVTALSIPGATGLTLLYGWFFGFWRAVLLISLASTAGATLAFLIARFFLRGPIQNRFGHRLRAFNQALEEEGAFYLFSLRLIPVVPFFVLNLVMGLTPIRTWTYWWVSQIGMLPATCVYVYAASSVPDLQTLADRGAGSILTPNVLIAFTALGLFPWAARKMVQWLRSAG